MTSNDTDSSIQISLDSIPSNLSQAALESKLHQLRQKVQEHSQILTQKLASSQSGQNLLHMGSSLSTLPPDLHSLLTQLHPLQTATEHYEDKQLQSLTDLVTQAREVREKHRRVAHANECAETYLDLVAAEKAIQKDVHLRKTATRISGETDQRQQPFSSPTKEEEDDEEQFGE